MEKLKIEYLPIEKLQPYKNNTRKHEKKDIETIKNSIIDFGFCDPIGIWSKENIIVEGHGRLLALKDLGYTVVPCIRLDHLNDDQRRAYAIAHNKTAEMSDWDYVLLDEELKNLNGIIEMDRFGFETVEEETQDDDTYTSTINVPTYEPTQDEPPAIEELTDTEKYNELLHEINAAKIPKAEKEFLRLAAARHIVFDYKNIAEYYAHASKETQDLMEKSALIIIDYDKAIEYGYAKIKSEIDDLRDAIEGDEDE